MERKNKLFRWLLGSVFGVNLLGASCLAAQAEVPAPGTVDAEGNVHLKSRVVPLPKLISPEAQQAMREAYAMSQGSSMTPPGGTAEEALKQAIARVDTAYEMIASQVLASAAATVERTEMAGVTVYVGQGARHSPGAQAARRHVHPRRGIRIPRRRQVCRIARGGDRRAMQLYRVLGQLPHATGSSVPCRSRRCDGGVQGAAEELSAR